jgi:hypothetical protein
MLRLSSLSLILPLSFLVACDGPKDDADAVDTGEDTDSGGDTDSGTDTDSEDSGAVVTIAVDGAWVDNWGGTHVISADAWSSWGATYLITQYDNDAGFAIAQNGAGNEWNAGLWSRFDWTWIDGELAYCQTAYDAATEADALGTAAADATNPDSGCGGFSWTWLRAPLALADSYDDSWGGTHGIDAFTWRSGDSSFAITEVDEAAGWLVAQNGASNAWSPGLWSRFDWTRADGALFYCQTAYDAATEADALATSAADADALGSGCGGFSWTELRPMLAINGDWFDSWGGSHSIDAFTWLSGSSSFAITRADDAAGWAVAQNGADNAWSPGLWSRFDWTWDADGGLWYCQTAYDAASEADALATPAADATDPATTGCGSFAWTSMTMAVR